MARYRFWIHDKDRKGQPLDENILKTAEEIAPTLTRYRRQEIDCESTSNDILQSAVEAASKAKRRNHVDNPPGYLTSIYKRIVDKFPKCIVRADISLEAPPEPKIVPTASSEREIALWVLSRKGAVGLAKPERKMAKAACARFRSRRAARRRSSSIRIPTFL